MKLRLHSLDLARILECNAGQSTSHDNLFGVQGNSAVKDIVGSMHFKSSLIKISK